MKNPLRVLILNNRSWYLAYKNNSNAKIRLFCFHHAGGSASAYYPWINLLSSNIEMIAIQLPGRENRFREPLNNNLNNIVDKLSAEFRKYTDKPFIVFGHSLGALLAFESIKAIRQLYSLYPNQMIFSATKAPHLPIKRENLSQLDNQTLRDKLKAYSGIDERILNNKELLDLFLPIIKSDFSIYENYQFIKSKPLPCNILTLSGNQDQTVTQKEILEWSSYTEKEFEHISFPGEHFFLKNHRKEILRIINKISENNI